MSIEWRILSIGALDAHDLREERAPVRTGHATTTLIRSGDVVCVVDPGLPGQILGARLEERAGITPADITHVFLTSFRPDVRRGIDIFENAQWLISEREREAVGVPMVVSLREADEHGESELKEALELDIAILQRFEPAPDSIASAMSRGSIRSRREYTSRPCARPPRFGSVFQKYFRHRQY